MTAANERFALTKSRYMTGLQCHRLLWWSVHEPEADELKIDVGTKDLFDQAREVEAEARKRFATGRVIGSHFDTVGARLEATRQAIAAGERVVFEASFGSDDILIRADALERLPEGGWALVEIKSSSSLKDEHIPDAAVQTSVLRRCGVDVRRVEIMHLSKAFRHPDVGELFERVDVTAKVEAFVTDVPHIIEQQVAALKGSLPAVPIGKHCSAPRDCAFWDRCWPKDRFHVTKLYRGRDKGLNLMRRGIELMSEIPGSEKLTDTQRRQKLSAERQDVVADPGLAAALSAFRGRLGYLDFETISRAIPVWPGTKPWQQTVVQFSYHEDRPGQQPHHEEYLAEGPGDPREDLSDALLRATNNAERIVMYSTFERSRIRDLQEALPHRRPELEALEAKLVDLLPVLQQHVYHPDFDGSFSIKNTLTPLVPELTYSDLLIQEGKTASVEIWRLLFVAHKIPPERRVTLRRELLRYCERDTLAMVRLLEELRRLAAPRPPQLKLL